MRSAPDTHWQADVGSSAIWWSREEIIHSHNEIAAAMNQIPLQDGDSVRSDQLVALIKAAAAFAQPAAMDSCDLVRLRSLSLNAANPSRCVRGTLAVDPFVMFGTVHSALVDDLGDILRVGQQQESQRAGSGCWTGILVSSLWCVCRWLRWGPSIDNHSAHVSVLTSHQLRPASSST
jgi:hypothetical protein